MRSLKESLLNDEEALVTKMDTKALIEYWLGNQNIRDYKLLKDNRIVINQPHILIELGDDETELPEYINFSRSKHNFTIRGRGLKSFRGFPKKTHTITLVECNSLEDLEGIPQDVKNYYMYMCEGLKSLKGLPLFIKGSIRLAYCPQLTSLKYCPKIMESQLFIEGCDSLEDLQGANEKFSYKFHSVIIKYNLNLKSLKGLPVIGNRFICLGNPKLDKDGFKEGFLMSTYFESLEVPSELKHVHLWSKAHPRYENRYDYDINTERINQINSYKKLFSREYRLFQ